MAEHHASPSVLPASPTAPPVEAPFAATYPAATLVVEDNLVNQKVLVRILQKLGYAPHLAVDGQQAVDAFSDHTIDLVFMDLQMPVMDGLTATRLIRAMEHLPRRPIIIAVTAAVTEEDRQTCFAAGMDGFIAKPATMEQIMAEVRRCLPAPAASARA